MTFRFIALGAGQCSSVLPFILKDWDEMIFADTCQEHPLTYEWIKILANLFPGRLKIVHTFIPEGIKHHPPICTKKYKVEPIRRFLKNRHINEAIKFLGFTKEEENRRAHENSVKWIKHEFPLIERGWTREDCQSFLLNKVGFVPIQSGCLICKYNKRGKYLIKEQEEDNET